MELFTAGLTSKFSGLLFFLKRSRQEFEMVGDEIEDHPLRSALNGLSAESNWYAGEIKNYLTSLGVSAQLTDHLKFEENESFGDYTVAESAALGGKVATICTHNEKSLLQAYSELLEEHIPFQTLKDIISYQLNALKYTFLKVKTLNDARFAAW